MSKGSPAKNSLEAQRVKAATWVQRLLLVPLGLVIFASVLLIPAMLFGSRDTVDQLARSVPVLVSLGMIIGLTGFMAGMLLLWFNVETESTFKFSVWVISMDTTTRGAGIVGMGLGTILAIVSIWVMTKIVFQTKPPQPVGIATPAATAGQNVTPGIEPKGMPSADPDFILEDKP